MFGVQQYYSIANNLNENAIVHNLSRTDHVMLMGKLPLSTEPYKFDLGGMGESIWICDGMTVLFSDPEYGAKVNGYLVPVNTEIVLWINKHALDRECPEHVVFDMYGGMGRPEYFIEKFYDVVGVIRFLENRRNAWLEDRMAKGLSLPQEYDCDTSYFDIRNNNMHVLFARPGTREARPNHIVSERLIEHYLGSMAARDDSFINNPEQYVGKWLHYFNNLEEFNMDLVNWINKNIYDLANLGFSGSTFPDVIHFDYSHRSSTYESDARHHLPVGIKVYKKVDNRTVSGKMSDAADQAKANVKAGASGFVKSPLLRAMIKMLPVLIVMLVLRLLGGHLYLFNRFLLLQLAIYICGSNLFVAMIYILCVLIYYGRHRS